MDNPLPQSNGTQNNGTTAHRDMKRLTRRYFTIVLSEVKTEEGIDWHCFNCGYIVLTLFNEPKAGIQIRIPHIDLGDTKVTESLCRKCNIMYRIV